MNIPHPIPYQGSKRKLTSLILSYTGSRGIRRFYEPFAGSAAMSIAMASTNRAERIVLGETCISLANLWKSVLTNPGRLADAYEHLWNGQLGSGGDYYTGIRRGFNITGACNPGELLYLLARCVKNSPRWNSNGEFNQSHDRRRLGTRPDRMRRELVNTSKVLSDITVVKTGDFEWSTRRAGPGDLVYLDPPWQGTSNGRDARYHQGLRRERLIGVLENLNTRRVPWILSYDGRCGVKEYGPPLSPHLGMRVELNTGRSSQATLNGVNAVTIESLYISPTLL